MNSNKAMKMKLNNELKARLAALHDLDYERGSWGAATSTPYRIKKWLSKSLSDKLLAAAYAEYGRAKAAFDSIPASKRVVHNATMLCPELRKWEGIGSQAELPIKVEGHAIYLACIEEACYKNTCYRRKAELCACSPEAFCFIVHGNNTGYPSYARLMKWMIYWDAEMQRFYRLEWKRASTQPIADSQKRRNWCRKSKEREFMSECKKLQAKLLENGIEIASVVHVDNWHNEDYVNCYDNTEIPDSEASMPGMPPPSGQPTAFATAVEHKGSICFTGKLDTLVRSEAEAMAKTAGYEISSSVVKDLAYLVTNTPDSGSSKNLKADLYGIKKITEAEFKELVKVA